VWLVALLAITFNARYIYQIWKRDISPTLSTWIIFLLGTGLSLGTYAIAKEHDFQSGILNSMDVIVVTSVLLAIILWGKRVVRFESFEKWYLCGVGAIVVYGFISGDAWNSNVLAQILITVGYIPTIQKLVKNKRNTESFTGWGGSLLVSLVALYPAATNGNALSVLYALRAIVLIIVMLSFMTYYELRSRKTRVQS
jgi:hypothetical protein